MKAIQDHKYKMAKKAIMNLQYAWLETQDAEINNIKENLEKYLLEKEIRYESSASGLVTSLLPITTTASDI